MKRLEARLLLGREQVSIHIGGVVASRNPMVIGTVLGSCISVCLRDAKTRVGGMNHFMLPMCRSDEDASTRYGVHAMELLINECMKAGADRRRLEAKLFGGGHVLKMRETDGNVPQSNIAFALSFLATENIPIISQDLGGYTAREVYYFTDTGVSLLKRLSSTGEPGVKSELVQMAREERAEIARSKKPLPDDDSNVTLF